MASIKDFFGGSGATSTMTRVTHGTAGQQYTWSCCNACCFCIPSNATSWTNELWGMGGGGANNCCCEWGCRGGGGANYGVMQWSPWSCGSSIMTCYCACSCYCASYSSDGSPGQFSRVHDCSGPRCTCIGGGQPGCACCNYGGTPSYMQSINQTYDFNASSGGGGSSAGSGTSAEGWQNTNTTMQQGGQDQFGNPFQNFTGGGSSGGGGGSGEVLTTFFETGNTCCSSGCATTGTTSANETFISRRGALGFSRLNGQCSVSCTRGGGGASYAGGFQNECCASNGNWAYCGCNGFTPGGGGSGGGACGGGCCFGGCGSQGVIMISYDT
tara:strand:+ start:647 stop:1627 length:981 start_codon:yes stop_codon:yes gene_type:complete